MSDIKCSACKGAKTITFEQGQRCVPCVTCSGSGIDWRKSYDAAQAELSALREELVMWKGRTTNVCMKLTAAEQRNAELVELLDSAFFRLDTFIEAEREMPIPSMEVLRDAILRHCPDLNPTESGASE